MTLRAEALFWLFLQFLEIILTLHTYFYEFLKLILTLMKIILTLLTLSINLWSLISLNFWNSLLYKFLKLNLYKLLKLIFNTSQFLNFNRTWERPAYLKDPEYLTTKPLLRICLTVVVLLYGELDYLVS